MPNDRELMRMHVDALYTHDPTGRMVAVNEPGGPRGLRFFLGRTAEGSVWRVRDDVDDELARALKSLCRAEPAGGELLHPPHGDVPASPVAPCSRTPRICLHCVVKGYFLS